MFSRRVKDPEKRLTPKYTRVVSLTEYHRRIDALNSEDLRSLCKRLQVPCFSMTAPL